LFTSQDSIAWTAELPGTGLSSPIVVGDRVIVTAASGYQQDHLHVLCFSASDGALLWERQFWATGRTMCHEKSRVAASSPASDGRRIFATFSTNDVASLDLDGNLLWYRGLTHDYPNASNSLGMASSPVVVGHTLVMQIEGDADSFAIGLDADNGLRRWKIDRPRLANWTSPVACRSGGQELILLQSARGATAVDPETGATEWSYTEGAANIASSAASGELVYIPSNGITAVRPYQGGDTPEIVWRSNRLSPATASPLVHQGRIYTINSAGVLACADAESGEPQWNLRLKGPFSSSPIAAGERLYAFNENGLAQVVSLRKPGALIFEHNLGEGILCTPALAGDALYVRSDNHLWKIARE
jgi:outer membrane protein assembly factor BamB